MPGAGEMARAGSRLRGVADRGVGGGTGPRLVVCGDNQLAYRVVAELVEHFDAEVTVIVRSRGRNHAARLAGLPGVRLVEAPELTVEALSGARLVPKGPSARRHRPGGVSDRRKPAGRPVGEAYWPSKFTVMA